MNQPTDQLTALATLTHEIGLSFHDAQEEFKKRLILNALTRHKGNQCAAARELQVHRNTLSRDIEALQIDPKQFRTTRERKPSQRVEAEAKQFRVLG